MKKFLVWYLTLSLLLTNSCSFTNTETENAILGKWEYESQDAGNSAYFHDLEFEQDGKLVIQNIENDMYYVVIAPGRLELTVMGMSNVVNFDLTGDTLKLYFDKGYNQYARKEKISQTTDQQLDSISTKENLIKESEEKPLNTRQVITPENVGTLIETHFIGEGMIRRIAFSPDGSKLAFSSSTAIHIYDTSELREIMHFETMSGVDTVAFSPISSIFAADINDKIVIWDITNGTQISTLSGHKGDVDCIAFSPDGRFLASGGVDGFVRLWDLTSGNEIRKFKGHNHYVKSLSFSPDGRILASGSFDTTVRLWDVERGEELNTLIAPISGVTTVRFSPDGKTLAAGGIGKYFVLWKTDNFDEFQLIESGYPSYITYSPDGKMIVVASTAINGIKFFDTTNGQLLHVIDQVS